MTAHDLAAALIADVKRLSPSWVNLGAMLDDEHGEYVVLGHVIAALSRALDPAIAARAGEVTRRLRKTEEAGHIHHLSKADRLATADLITALLAQNAALRAERDALREQIRESALQELASLGQAQEAYEAQKAAEAKVAEYEAEDGMDGAIVHAIRLLLNSHNVPAAAFIDDHVGNAIAQRDAAEAKVERLRGALRELIDHTHNCERELTEELHKVDFCGESLPLTNARAALAPTDAAHVNVAPKSEHDAGNVLTDAAQARETALKKAAQLAYEVWDDPEALAKAILALIGETRA